MADQPTKSISTPSKSSFERESARRWQGEIGGLLQNVFFDVRIEGSESVTWQMGPNPWNITNTSGGVLFAVSNATFTKARATLVEGGYRAWWTYAGSIQAQSWRCVNPPVQFSILLKNSQNGLLIQQSATRSVECRESGSIILSSDFDPDIYGILQASEIECLASTFYAC